MAALPNIADALCSTPQSLANAHYYSPTLEKLFLTTSPCLPIVLDSGQTVRWIKMPLGKEVGLGPDHIVLDVDTASPRKGAQQSPLFGPCIL